MGRGLFVMGFSRLQRMRFECAVRDFGERSSELYVSSIVRRRRANLSRFVDGRGPSFLETMKSLCSSFVCCYDSANRFVSLYLDVNECLSGLDNCDPYANCVDTQPGFQCSCPFPYVGNGNGTHCDGGNIKIQGNKVIFTLICVLI